VLAGTLESMSKDTRKPSKLWKFVNTDKKAENLAKLALRLFGIGINSASTRCFLSQAGIAHTKLRNRLSFEWSICTSWRANLSAFLRAFPDATTEDSKATLPNLLEDTVPATERDTAEVHGISC